MPWGRALRWGAVDYALLPRTAVLRRKSRELWCMRLCRRGKSAREKLIDMQWSEKLLIVFDQLQIFALLYITECPGSSQRFPQVWCQEVAGLTYMNLDGRSVFDYNVRAMNGTFTESTMETLTGSSWYQVEHRFGLLLLLSPPGLFVLLCFYFWYIQDPLKYYLRRGAIFVPHVERLVIRFLYCIFMPWNVFLARSMLCVEMSAIFDWQRTISCANLHPWQILCKYCQSTLANCSLSSSFILEGSLLIVAAAIYALGFPLLLRKIVHHNTPHNTQRKHERWIKSLEAEFIVEASSDWDHNNLSLNSSFTLFWSNYLSLSLVMKLVFPWVVMGCYKRSYGDIIRDTILLVYSLVWLIVLWWKKCYRLQSSQLFVVILTCTNFFTIVVRALMSLGYKTKLLFMLGLLLPLHHCVGLFFACLAVAISVYQGETWPMTMEKLRRCDEAIDMEVVEMSAEDVNSTRSSSSSARSHQLSNPDSLAFGTVFSMVETMRETLLEEQLRTPEFVRPRVLSSAISQLEELLHEARRNRHPLLFTIEDLLEEFVDFRNSSLHISLFLHEPLVPLIVPLREFMDRRQQLFFFTGVARRRILLKLFACRQFILIREDFAKRHHVDRWGPELEFDES